MSIDLKRSWAIELGFGIPVPGNFVKSRSLSCADCRALRLLTGINGSSVSVP